MDGTEVQEHTLHIAQRRTLNFVGKKILDRTLRRFDTVSAYATNRDLIVLVQYPVYQPTDEISTETEHAVIPLEILRRAAGRGKVLRWIFGGADNLIFDSLNEKCPAYLINEMLRILNLDTRG